MEPKAMSSGKTVFNGDFSEPPTPEANSLKNTSTRMMKIWKPY
jgi:hypothetical protein